MVTTAQSYFTQFTTQASNWLKNYVTAEQANPAGRYTWNRPQEVELVDPEREWAYHRKVLQNREAQYQRINHFVTGVIGLGCYALGLWQQNPILSVLGLGYAHDKGSQWITAYFKPKMDIFKDGIEANLRRKPQ